MDFAEKPQTKVHPYPNFLKYSLPKSNAQYEMGLNEPKNSPDFSLLKRFEFRVRGFTFYQTSVSLSLMKLHITNIQIIGYISFPVIFFYGKSNVEIF